MTQNQTPMFDEQARSRVIGEILTAIAPFPIEQTGEIISGLGSWMP